MYSLVVVPFGCCLLIGLVIFSVKAWRSSDLTTRGRTTRLVVATTIAIPLIACIIYAASIDIGWWLWARQARNTLEQRQRKLLYQTDHKALAQVGREMLNDTNRFAKFPDHTNLPPILRDLDPSYGTFADDRSWMNVEMGGGFFHFGFTIYREGVTGGGLKELVPGVWYHSEDHEVIEPK